MVSEILKAENLRMRLGGREVLKGVKLCLRTGECLALLGPSGSGKTTLLRLIAGLADADAGQIEIGGQTCSSPKVVVPPSRRGVSMVFQDLALWPHMRAWENVEFMLPVRVRGSAARKSHALELLHSLHLANHFDRYPHQLSRGEQQRVALARALALEPSLLLLDEPFSSLDYDLKSSLIELLREIHQTRKMTLLYVTHAVEELPRLANRVARIRDGTVEVPVDINDFSCHATQRS